MTYLQHTITHLKQKQKNMDLEHKFIYQKKSHIYTHLTPWWLSSLSHGQVRGGMSWRGEDNHGFVGRGGAAVRKEGGDGWWRKGRAKGSMVDGELWGGKRMAREVEGSEPRGNRGGEADVGGGINEWGKNYG